MERRGRKLSPGFFLRIVGSDVVLLSVSFRSLARILAAVQRLIDQREEEELVEPASSRQEPAGECDDRALKLIKVANGSAVYGVAAADSQSALRVLNDTGHAIHNPSKSEWTSATLSSIQDLSEVARSIGCDIEFRRTKITGGFGDIIATITPKTYDEISTSAFVHGQTSIFGNVLRVGGITEMHCGMRIPNRRRMLICRVSDAELVRQLGQYVYQDVLIHGEATWLRHNWYLKHFIIRGFDKPKTGDMLDALDRVYEAGGKAWDRIDDPNAYIAEMRGP